MNGFKKDQGNNAPSESGFNMKIFHDNNADTGNDSDTEEPPAKYLKQVRVYSLVKTSDFLLGYHR